MSDLEKIKYAVQMLKNVNIPVSLTESVTVPVFNAVILLNDVCKSMEKREKEGPKIEVEEAGYIEIPEEK